MAAGREQGAGSREGERAGGALVLENRRNDGILADFLRPPALHTFQTLGGEGQE